jgi:exodeoxyribonuclease VII large subunit
VRGAQRALDGSGRVLDATEARVRALDPARVLARGWSITRRADGSVVRSIADVGAGDELRTTIVDGDVASTVSAPPTPSPTVDPDG